MPTLKTIRLLNSLESNTITTSSNTTLQTILSDTGKLGEFNNLINIKSQAKRLSVSTPAMSTVANTTNAITAVINSSVAFPIVMSTPTSYNIIKSCSNVSSIRTYLNSNLVLGVYYPHFGGFFAGSIALTSSTSYYFAAPKYFGQNTSQITWGPYPSTPTTLNLSSYTYSTTLNDNTNNSNAAYDGKYITENILNTSSYPAANWCKNITLSIGGIVFSDWFLPSIYELDVIVRNKDTFNINSGGESWDAANYWCSSEVGTLNSWYVNFTTGEVGNYYKSSKYSVRAVRKITI